jgi:hypothetical protein
MFMNNAADYSVLFVSLAFVCCLFAISLLRALPLWINSLVAARALRKNDDSEAVVVASKAKRAAVTVKSLVAEGYGSEEVNCFGRMLIIAQIEKKAMVKRAKNERKEERIAALYVKDVARTAQKLARSERSRLAWARKKASKAMSMVEVQMAA